MRLAPMMMSRRRLLALLTSVAAPDRAAGPVAALGRLTPFYRSTQLQGHLIGMGLTEIPDYLLDSDGGSLRYQRKSGMVREIPFVDSFTINRFLGGYRADWLKRFHLWDDRLGARSLDYVIRRGDGSLQFRPELIAARLKPYLDAGYRPSDITLALENVPWDVAEHARGGEGPWGQDRPPEDAREWERIIRQFATDAQAYLGPGATNIGFETGVEYDERVSFDATADEFYSYYAATDRGLHAVLPRATLSPGEFTGLGTCDETAVASCVYDTRKFLEFAKQHGLAVSTVPRSLHALLSSPNPMPSAASDRATRSYARLPEMTPEIHQFGLLGLPFSDEVGADPAAMQASWQFQTLMRVWASIKPRRVFHWGGLVEIGKLQLLNGAGFLRLVLDQYIGHQAFLLRADEQPDSSAGRCEVLAAAFAGPRSSALIISSFSPQIGGQRRTVRTEIPPGLLKGGASVRTLRYRASDNVFALIRRDLEAEGNLKPLLVRWPGYTGEPIKMASDPGRARAMLARNSPRYVAALRDSLRWRTDDDDVAVRGNDVSAGLEENELLVLQLGA